MNLPKLLFMAVMLFGIAGVGWVTAAKPFDGWTIDAAQEKQAHRSDIAHGKKVYDGRCEICHYRNSTQKKVGPGLKGLMARGKYVNGKKLDDESLRAWIENGGKDMPGFKGALKEDEIRDLVAYLKTL
jgi:cytochrome c2